MRDHARLEARRHGGSWLIAGALTLAVLATAAPTAAQRPVPVAQRPCAHEGTWLSAVDIGALFFTQYSAGATGNSGALTVEWIAFDPTLFGNFPNAVRTTQGMGSWRQSTAGTYRYTWVAYGLDSAGLPLYAVRTSGTGTFAGCDHIDFDWVMEIFPYPMNPLTDAPLTCMSGTGAKDRIPVVNTLCED